MTEKMLSGKVAVVTGAGTGIGGAICRTFAQVGAKLACLDIDESAVVVARPTIRRANPE
jgi:NAD(P)-dependent dehydrogenase (short-subunit alcohol dehydrogenase family)